MKQWHISSLIKDFFFFWHFVRLFSMSFIITVYNINKKPFRHTQCNADFSSQPRLLGTEDDEVVASVESLYHTDAIEGIFTAMYVYFSFCCCFLILVYFCFFVWSFHTHSLSAHCWLIIFMRNTCFYFTTYLFNCFFAFALRWENTLVSLRALELLLRFSPLAWFGAVCWL